MILDFAAANDPSLVEQGMKMASGFRSAADYHASTQPAAEPATPAAAVVPEADEAIDDEPATQIVSMPPITEPEAPPVRPRTATPVPGKPPVRVTPAGGVPPVRTTPHTTPEAARVANPRTTQIDPDLAVSAPSSRPPVRRETLASKTPPAQQTPDLDEEAPTMAPGQFQLPAGGIKAALEAEAKAKAAEDEARAQAEAKAKAEADAQARAAAEAAAAQAIAAKASEADHAAHPPFGDDDDDLPTMVVPAEAREQARQHMEAEKAKAAEAKARAEAEALEQARTMAPPSRTDREPEVDTTPSGRERVPPHTPPGLAKPSLGNDDDEAEKSGRRPVPAKQSADSVKASVEPYDDPDQKRMSTFGVVIVALLLLTAFGLIGASLALENTADPRPLLEKLYRQNVK